MAREGEKAGKDSCVRWNFIRKLQVIHAGRKPTRPSVVLKEDGVLTADLDEVKSRWRKHFTRLLNIPSSCQEETITDMPSQPTCWDLDVPPTMEELDIALDRIKEGKAGGKTEILPEMILAGDKELWSRLHQLAVEVWVERKVVADWQDAQIVPIPKKGDLRVCDNWIGISLLDVVGKVFAKIVQKRLQIIANSSQFNTIRPEEGQSTLTETSARQTCLSHAGIREPNLSHCQQSSTRVSAWIPKRQGVY